jgi:hypothetical protein
MSESSAKNVIPRPPAPNRRDKQELAFLPAALEVVETPPSPIGWAIGVTIIALFGLALAWRGRHHRRGAGKNHPEWAYQSHPAVRDQFPKKSCLNSSKNLVRFFLPPAPRIGFTAPRGRISNIHTNLNI